MDIVLDRTSRVPLYRQIAERFERLIAMGALPDSFQLPPERGLAESLGVNRTTVLSAYRELKAAGLVGAHVGRGTAVLPRTSRRPAETGEVAPVRWGQLFSRGVRRSQDPLLRDLLEVTERLDVISLSIGLPAPELLPLDTLARQIDALFREVGASVLSHCPTEGHTPLRESLCTWLATRGIHAHPAEVLVVSGSQQGLDLAARVFLDPGDLVVVEEPSYIGALQVFAGAQARVVGVPVDQEGMRTDALATVLERQRPKLIYTLPTFQNPSGAVLSLERRRMLLELAERSQVPILEDDPYSELRYDGEALPALKALDRRGQVLYLSTFSKVLFPGMRLGFVVAPGPVVRQLVLAKQVVDLHSNTLGQYLLDRFLREGHMEAHLRLLRAAYARRRDAMREALRPGLEAGLSWCEPAGGFYFWCRLPDGIEQSLLFSRAAERGVVYLPGRSCFCGDDGTRAFARLNFSFPDEKTVAQGVGRFLDALREVSRRIRTPRPHTSGTPPVV